MLIYFPLDVWYISKEKLIPYILDLRKKLIRFLQNTHVVVFRVVEIGVALW